MDQSRISQEHRLKRAALWAALWLAKLIRFMPDVLNLPLRVQAYVERRLTLLEDFVANLIMIRAAHLHRANARVRDRFCVARAQRNHDVRVRIRHSLRAAMGGRLRRALKTRGALKTRAEAILHNLQHQEQLARACVRRMRRSGLSRRTSAHSRAAETLPLMVSCIAEALFANAGPLSAALGDTLRADTS